MATLVGKLRICDRCGKQEFTKYIGKEDFDGGFTQYDKFAPGDPGWRDVHLDTTPRINALLCTDCMKELSKITKDFMEVNNETRMQAPCAVHKV